MELKSDASFSERFLVNVEVWEVIFDFLDVKHRIQTEMSDKRLCSQMLSSWKRVALFDVADVIRMFSHPKNRAGILSSICVHRIGNSLRTLKLRDDDRSSTAANRWTADLRSVGDGCSNIDAIHFHSESAPSQAAFLPHDVRFDSFTRLKTLVFTTAQRGFFVASASVFASIPSAVEVIVGLAGTTRLNEEDMFETTTHLEDFFANRPLLKEVRLAGLHTRDERRADIFRVIAARCSQLKKIDIRGSNVDWSGVVALEAMKELRVTRCMFRDIAQICARSPLVEVLELFASMTEVDEGGASLDAVGELTRLVELRFGCERKLTPAAMFRFVRKLVHNSGTLLRQLELGNCGYLSNAALQTLASGCPKLRRTRFYVSIGEATAASIPCLIDSIIHGSSWTPAEDTLSIIVYCHCTADAADGDEAAAFRALASPSTCLPSGVELDVHLYQIP